MKSLRSSLLVLLTLVTLLNSKPSHATYGAAYGASAVVLTGLGYLGGGGAVAYGGIIVADKKNKNLGELIILIGSAAALLGLVILDQDQSVAFSPIDQNEAKKLGVSLSEAKIYNSELDQANSLLAYVAEELGGSASNEDSVALWSEVKESVSPETFLIMTKLAARM